jgi:hypothetical protein
LIPYIFFGTLNNAVYFTTGQFDDTVLPKPAVFVLSAWNSGVLRVF